MSLINVRATCRILLVLGSLAAFGCATLNEKSSPNAVIGEVSEGVCTLDVADGATTDVLEPRHLIDEAGQPTIAARDEILSFFARRLAS